MHPSDVRIRFARVLSALWSKRKASYEGLFLVAGPARGQLAPFDGLLITKKLLLCPFPFLWGPEWNSDITMENSFFAHFDIFCGQMGTPAGDARMRLKRVLSALLEQTKSVL